MSRKAIVTPSRNTFIPAAGLIAMACFASFGAGAPVRTLPNFALKLVDGNVVRSKDLAGKVTVIDFWGTWCKPCLVEIPGYNAFFKEYRNKGVAFIALAADSGTASEVLDATKRLKIEYPVAAPSWEELDLFGNIEVFPTTMVFDGSGKLAKEFYGASAGKQRMLREVVDQLLATRPPASKTAD